MTDTAETTEAAETEVAEPESISDLFDDDAETSGETTTEAETSEKVETETEEKAETETAETETEKAETEETDSETTSEEESSVPRKALLDERRKRQEAEERLKQLEPDEEAPDPTDDLEGYEKHLRAKWERERWQQVANQSRERMLEKQSDYEEKEKHFLYLASQDPELVKQMNEDPDPAAFAYNKAKESLEAQEKAVEERVVERLKKEGKLKEETADTEAASRVSELTSATGAGKNTGAEPVKESVNPEDVFDDMSY